MLKDILGATGWVIGVLSLLVTLFPISATNKIEIMLLIIIICLVASIVVIVHSYKEKEANDKQSISELEAKLQKDDEHKESLHTTHLDDKRKIRFLRDYWNQIGTEIEILELSEAKHNPVFKKLRSNFVDLNDKLLKSGGIDNE